MTNFFASNYSVTVLLDASGEALGLPFPFVGCGAANLGDWATSSGDLLVGETVFMGASFGSTG
jgi:hypothetical protein